MSTELRSALQTIGNAAIGIGLGLALFGMAFVISNFATGQGSAVPASPRASASPVAPSPSTAAILPPTAALVSPSALASPSTATMTPTPTPTPTPAATTTVNPLTVTAYRNSGRRYAALSAPVGYAYTSPLGGTVQIRMYQFIQGEVRVGSHIPSLAFYPYVIVTASDRRVTFRPGANTVDTELLVQDGTKVEPGTPLFKTIGTGPSSWATFYDLSVTANVIASVVSLPGERELDPVAFFMDR